MVVRPRVARLGASDAGCGREHFIIRRHQRDSVSPVHDRYLLAIRRARLAWLAVAFAALVVVNGALHLLASAAFSTYSPGAVAGALLYLPVGSAVLVNLSRSLPSQDFVRGIVAGLGVHVVVTVAALA